MKVVPLQFDESFGLNDGMTNACDIALEPFIFYCRSWWEKGFSTAAFLNVEMELELRPTLMQVAATSTLSLGEQSDLLVGFLFC